MSFTAENILEAVEQAKKSSKKRGFVQSIDLIISLRDIDVRKPEERIEERVELPNWAGKEKKVCVIASGSLAIDARKAEADLVVDEEALAKLTGDKKAIKRLAREYDFFIAESSLMPIVGKSMGFALGPRGKMPMPVPLGVDIKTLLERHRRSVRLRARDRPVVQCKVGKEDMPSEKIVENIQAVISKLEHRLKKGLKNIDEVYVKTTMGPSISIKRA